MACQFPYTERRSRLCRRLIFTLSMFPHDIAAWHPLCSESANLKGDRMANSPRDDSPTQQRDEDRSFTREDLVRGTMDEDSSAFESDDDDEYDATEIPTKATRTRAVSGPHAKRTPIRPQSTCHAAVILDVDGTLVDSNDAHARAWVEAFADNGITVAFDHVRRAIGMGGDKLMPAVADIQEDSPIGRRIAERRGQIFTTKYLPALQPFPGSRDLVQRLDHDGFALAVASSAEDKELKPLLQIAGAADLIEHEASADDAGRSKPDPDIVHAALARTRCSPSHAVMIGDTPYDVEAAGRAGVEVVAFECGGWTREELKDAIEVYAGRADLLARYDRSIFARMSRLSNYRLVSD
jgi:HAD superfamily hydrolase (TIGR01509 family)